MSLRWRNLCYAALGSGSALGSLTLAGRCSASCTSCYGCLLAGGTLAGLALSKRLWKTCKEKQDGMAQGSR